MSHGYLMVSNGKIDELSKNRCMKFELIAVQGNLYGYERMEYLNRHIMMEDFINKAFKAIRTNIKIPALFLHGAERPEVERDQLYRIASKPPDQGRKSWRR